MNASTHTPKPHLEWTDLWTLGTSDNAKRWYPRTEIERYFRSYRSPSRAWPWSYAKAALTAKFLLWLKENEPDLVPERFTK